MKVLVLFFSVLSSFCFAMDMTAKIDLRNTVTDASLCTGTAGCTAGTQLFYDIGMTTKIDLSSDFGIRTGGVLSQRGVKLNVSPFGDGTVNYMHLDIPVLAEYKASDSFAIYGGLVLGVKTSSSCTPVSGGNCSGINDKSLITPVQLGGSYLFDKAWSANLTYESGGSLGTQGASDFKIANVIMLGGSYTF